MRAGRCGCRESRSTGDFEGAYYTGDIRTDWSNVLGRDESNEYEGKLPHEVLVGAGKNLSSMYGMPPQFQ